MMGTQHDTRKGKTPAEELLPLSPGTQLTADIKILDIIGFTKRGGLYLASRTREKERCLVWESRSRQVAHLLGQPEETFSREGWHYQVFPIMGVRLGNVLRTVGWLDETWVATAWGLVCRDFGIWHREDPPLILLANQPLDLRAYWFNRNGRLLPPSLQVGESRSDWDYDSPMVFFAYKDDEAKPSADVYALGSAMYMLLSGKHPAEDPRERVPLRALNPAIAEETEAVVNKALRPNQERRYPNGRAMAADMYRLREALRQRKRRTRRKTQILPPWVPVATLLVTLAFLVLAIGGGLATGLLAPFLPEMPTLTPSPTPVPHTVEVKLVFTVTPSPLPTKPPIPVKDNSVVVNQVGEENQQGGNPNATPVTSTPEGTRPAAGLMTALPMMTATPENGSVSSLEDLGQVATPSPGSSRAVAYVSVLDKDGNPVSDLLGMQFSVYRDGELLSGCAIVPIQQAYEPIAAVIAIDISGSMEGEPLEKAQQAAIQYVQRSHPEDRLALLQFDDRIEWLSDFTTDHEALIRLIGGMRSRGDTALNDTVYEAADKLRAQEGRRALLILTDGMDTASRNHKLNEALALLQTESIPAFAIGLNSKQFTDKPLLRLAEETNGRYLYAPTPDELLSVYRQIGEQLENQYRIECPVLPSVPGEHEIRVVVSDGQHEIEGSKKYIVAP